MTISRRFTIAALVAGGMMTAAAALALSARDVPPDPSQAQSYRFNQPDHDSPLDRELDEISGLAVGSAGQLYAIQDENGILFELDPRTGTVLRRVQFGKKGDYEGIAYAGGIVHVLRSDGRLFRFRPSDDEAEVEVIDTGIHKDCDAEGLVHDGRLNRLLIACKENPGTGRRGERAVYGFDLDGGSLRPEPAVVIDMGGLSTHVKEGRLRRALRAAVEPVIDGVGFRPSGMAVHPMTGELYMLSSGEPSILVLDEEGIPLRLIPLSAKLLEQPEGIAFLPDGSLVIASERASQKRARLMVFNVQPGGAN